MAAKRDRGRADAGASPEHLWEQALPRIRAAVGDQNFDNWIAPLVVTRGRDELALAAPDNVVSASVNRHFIPVISKVLAEVAGHHCTVHVSVGLPQGRHYGPPRPQETATFQRFVVGSSNRDAYEKAVAVATGRVRGPGPLVLYGGVGVGKTHLANAIANAIRSDLPAARGVICESCMDFVDRLVATVGGGPRLDAPPGLHEVTALILDDVHFVAGHWAVQSALVQVFSTLHDRGAAVVLTSDRAPREIPDVDQRLRERFEGGVMAEILPPELDLRRRILLRKAADRGVELSNEVAQFLAERIVGSGRALEGALTRVCAYAATLGAAPLRLTRAVVATALRAFELPRGSISPEVIGAVVAEARGLSPRGLASRSRSRDVTAARQLAMYLSRKLTRLPLTEIAHRFGRHDHTTVLHACTVIEARRGADPAFSATVDRLEELVRARVR
jgi:chromosomal replication initiator protein